MRIKKFLYYLKFAPFIVLLLSLSYGFKGDNKKGGGTLNKTVTRMAKTTSGKVGDGYRIDINNLDVPVNNKGIIAEVNLPDGGTTNGYYHGHEFLFSGGFFLSGTRNGSPWANAVAAATLVEDYTPGTVASGETDPRAQLYVLRSEDPPFGQSWQDWKDAVDLGADFYDGDNDGVYNPVDANGNGKWDANEDAPDLLGDETVWCVYNDGLPAAQRRWTTISPMGIEIRQTVFGFASAGAIGNLLFVRYRIKYVGLNKPDDPESLNDVYFGVWADPDVGEVDGYNHNLVGCDTIRNSGYTYLKDPSPTDWGNQPPCFMIDFFSGPKAYIPGVTFIDNNGNGIYDPGDTPRDTAHSVRGSLLGIQYFPGARNQPLSSFVEYINGNSVLNDPDNATQARSLILGLSRTGEVVDPCNWAFGEVRGTVNCADVDPRFWYSGDPVTDIGWINTEAADIRQMSNTGPFVLQKDSVQEIVVAYVVGQGSSPLNSITVTKQIDDGAQFIFDQNFVAPSPAPAVTPGVSTGEDFIDLTWDTAPQVSFVDSTETYNDKFEGYNVYAYQSNSTATTVNNENNRTLVARYTLKDFIQDVYVQNANTSGIELLYPAPDEAHQLDKSVYADSLTGRIRLRITQDPFTGGRLVKGRPYYFSITSYSLNHNALIYKDDPNTPLGTPGDYYITAQSFVGLVENIAKITQVTMGENLYNPPFATQDGSHISGGSEGLIQYDVVDKQALTGDKYNVTFTIDSATSMYSAFWNLEDVNTGNTILDSSKSFLYGTDKVSGTLTDGFIVKLSDEVPEIDTITGETAEDWADMKYYYVSKDMGVQSRRLPGGGSQLTTLQGDYLKADKLRKVELRFDAPGKAYRYLNGYVGVAVPLRRKSYTYAGGVTASNPNIPDPSILSDIGKLGEGFVDVPFTAWVEDPNFGEERQLAVGFLERKTSEGGNPDGVWDPGTNVDLSGEYIFIFDTSYDPNGGQIEYKGNFPASTTVWADLNGYEIPEDASATEDQRKLTSSPFFNTLYVVALSRLDSTKFYSAGDKFIVSLKTYPYTPDDVFEIQTRKNGELTTDEEKDLFKKVNVFPNPLYGFNPATSYTKTPADDPFITFSNLPRDITITIYSLSGNKLRTLTTNDKSSPSSPFLEWDLKNETGIRVASGLYIAIVNSPKYGQKVLKFSIIMPQKQLKKY